MNEIEQSIKYFTLQLKIYFEHSKHLREGKIAVAMEALAGFGFDEAYIDRKSHFIKESVLEYLESPIPELRRKASKIVFHLSSAENPRFQENPSLSNRVMQGIINKLLMLALNDSEPMVRRETLQTLCLSGVKFNKYLITEGNLQKLLLCIEDQDLEVQKQSVLLVQQLVPSSPEILSMMQYLLFRIISSLSTKSKILGETELKFLIRLSNMAKTSPHILFHKNHIIIKTLTDIINQGLEQRKLHITESVHLNKMLAVGINCLCNVLKFYRKLGLQFHRDSIELGLLIIETGEEELLKCVLKLFSVIVSRFGSQLLLLGKFDLIKICFDILQKNHALEINLQTLKLIGKIGAIDPLIVSRIADLRQRGLDLKDPQQIISFLQKITPTQLHFTSHLEDSKEALTMEESFEKFKFSARSMENFERIKQNKKTIEIQQSNVQIEHIKNDSLLTIQHQTLIHEQSPYEIYNQSALLHFVTDQTLRSLFNLFENDYHEDLLNFVLDVIEQIIFNIAKYIFIKYKSLVFPNLIALFYKLKPISIRKHILLNIKHFLLAAGFEIAKEPEYVDKLVEVFNSNLQNEQLQDDLFEIMNVITDYKKTFKHQLKNIISPLLALLVDPPQSRLKQIFNILTKLDQSETLDLVIPVLSRILRDIYDPGCFSKTSSAELIENVFLYFEKLIGYSEMWYHFSNVTRICIQYLSCLENEKKAVFKELNFLTPLIKRIVLGLVITQQEKMFVFLPEIHPYLKNYEPYAAVLESLKVSGYVEAPTRKITKISDSNFKVNDTASFERISVREISLDNIYTIFDVKNIFKPEDWEDWLNKLLVDLVMKSPSTVLICCKELNYIQPLLRDLFVPSFAVMWSQMNESQKTYVLKNLNIMITTPDKVPVNVLKQILELIKFMSRNAIDELNLDVAKVSDLAIRCLKLSKAIYFKELEFNQNPERCLQSLLYLYSKTGYKDAADGLLEYAQKSLKLSLKTSWLESLGRWHKGLAEYRKEVSFDAMNAQIKCYSALSQYDFVLQKVKELNKRKKLRSQMEEKTAFKYAAKAAFHLQEWTDLKLYISELNSDTEKEFYNAVIAIREKRYIEARLTLKNLRTKVLMEKDGFSDFQGSYEKVERLQEIAELEEIVSLKLTIEDKKNDQLHIHVLGKDEVLRIKNELRNNLIQNWEDRFTLMEPNLTYMENILAIRSLLCTPEELLQTHLKFAKICFKQGHLPLYRKTLRMLHNERIEKGKELLTLARVECLYKTGELNEKNLIEYVTVLFRENRLKNDLKGLFFKKVGKWLLNSDQTSIPQESIAQILHESSRYNKTDPQLWHLFGLANYKAHQHLQEDDPKVVGYIKNVFNGFVKYITLDKTLNRKFIIQDLLRVLRLIFKYGARKELELEIEHASQSIPCKDWLLVVGQIIARLDETNDHIWGSIKRLLKNISQEFPQKIIFPLIICKKSDNDLRMKVANKLLGSIDSRLVAEAYIFADELIRISSLQEELWYNGIMEAAKYYLENRTDLFKDTIDSLYRNLNKANTTPNEVWFFQQYGAQLQQGKESLTHYFQSRQEVFLNHAWNFYIEFCIRMDKRVKALNELHLENTSPALLNFRNSLLIVPGSDRKNTSKPITISSINSYLTVLRSKRKPRRILINGSDQKEYAFLLKGNEDLRQDERVMQLLSLVNDLVKASKSVDHKSLNIVTFNVLPLSLNTGLISWVEDSETLYQLVYNYRTAVGVNPDSEKQMAEQYFHNYDILSKLRKVEVFRYVCEYTKAEDLKKIFWLKSASAEEWIAKRSNFIRSIAVMSIVGYILGLGDRHLSNLMLQRFSGKIVHIDFGDCFETANRRDKYPEKVPFRLTRILVNAMEACGIEGTFKKTCETVMNLVRSNKESLLAILEEFLVDPLITWRLLNEMNNEIKESKKEAEEIELRKSILELNRMKKIEDSFTYEGAVEMEKKQKNAQNLKNKQMMGKASLAILRITNKLNGRDFDGNEILNYKDQVEKLIIQATLSENISQSYSGWNPFL